MNPWPTNHRGRPSPPPGPPLPWDRVVLSVVIPTFNEIATAERLLGRVREVPLRLEVVVVDDGSTDGTRELLERLRDEGLVDRLVFHERNRGKGAAVRTGFAAATGDVVVIQDADLEYDPYELPMLLEPILGRVGRRGLRVALPGGRAAAGPHVLALPGQPHPHLRVERLHRPEPHRHGDLLQDDPAGSPPHPSPDPRPLRHRARDHRPPLAGRRADLRDACLYRGRSYAEGKKIGWKDGVAAFWHIFRSNFLPPRAPRWSGGPFELRAGEKADGS
jgi:glycosyltransferase involved in cell wall biosynthesis